MKILYVIGLACLVAVPSMPHPHGEGGEGGHGEEGGPVKCTPEELAIEKDMQHNFQMEQMRRLGTCGQLYQYPDICIFVHEAMELCACTCDDIINNGGAGEQAGGPIDQPQPFVEEPLRPSDLTLNEPPPPADSQSGPLYEYEYTAVDPRYGSADAADAADGAYAADVGGGHGGGLCFHGDDTVITSRGPMKMRQLTGAKGVRVQAFDSANQAVVTSPITYWIHADENVKAWFHVIGTKSGQRISITGRHLIYRSTDCSEAGFQAVFAERVVVGDCVRTVTEAGENFIDEVLQVDQEEKVGIYAPITSAGSIVVNQVVASCFAEFENEDLQRFIYSMLISTRDMVKYLLPTQLGSQIFGSLDNNKVLSHVPDFWLVIKTLEKYLVL